MSGQLLSAAPLLGRLSYNAVTSLLFNYIENTLGLKEEGKYNPHFEEKSCEACEFEAIDSLISDISSIVKTFRQCDM
jgi:hypothetical protein